MGKYSFYALVGRNGIAVANSWPAVCTLRKSIRHASVTGFDNFHEAEDWAIDHFEDRFPRLSGGILSLSINRPVFVGQLKMMEE